MRDKAREEMEAEFSESLERPDWRVTGGDAPDHDYDAEQRMYEEMERANNPNAKTPEDYFATEYGGDLEDYLDELLDS